MIVVDVNILAFYFLEGEKTADVNNLRKIDADWIVPNFWLIEFQSILWKYVRFGGMEESQALLLLERCRKIIGVNEHVPSPESVLGDALSLGITVYDAQYVSLAKQLEIPCITEDVPLQKACPGLALSIKDYVAFHSGKSSLRERRGTYRTQK